MGCVFAQRTYLAKTARTHHPLVEEHFAPPLSTPMEARSRSTRTAQVRFPCLTHSSLIQRTVRRNGVHKGCERKVRDEGGRCAGMQSTSGLHEGHDSAFIGQDVSDASTRSSGAAAVTAHEPACCIIVWIELPTLHDIFFAQTLRACWAHRYISCNAQPRKHVPE